METGVYIRRGYNWTRGSTHEPPIEGSCAQSDSVTAGLALPCCSNYYHDHILATVYIIVETTIYTSHRFASNPPLPVECQASHHCIWWGRG